MVTSLSNSLLHLSHTRSSFVRINALYHASCGWKHSIHFSNPHIYRFDSKKKKGKISYPPRHLPPLPFSDRSTIEPHSRPPVVRGVCMFHLEARSNYRLGEYRRRESEFPWTGRVIANIDFNLGRSKYARVCCSPPRGGKKNKVDLFARARKIYIYIFENGIYFRDTGDRLRRVR